MGFADFIGGVSNTIQDARGAWSKPRIARERTAKARSAADQRNAAQGAFQQGLLNDQIKANSQVQLAEIGLPTAVKVGTATQDLELRGKGQENNLAQSNQILNADLLGQTIDRTADAKGKFEGDKANADVARMSGWAGEVLPAFRENVIAPAQQHELALMDRTFGATAPLELAGQLEREQMGLQKEMFDKEREGRLPRWLMDGAELATRAAGIFML